MINLTLIANTSELTGDEQKALYSAGADINSGVYYLIADAQNFSIVNREVQPNTPAMRALTIQANMTWILTNFRGKFVGFGSSKLS